MKPSRRTQPYRRGSRQRVRGPAFTAMMRGRDAAGNNPADGKRAMQKLASRRRRRRRRIRRAG